MRRRTFLALPLAALGQNLLDNHLLGVLSASAAETGAKADLALAPDVAERLPGTPLVVDLPAKERLTGIPGGELQTLIGRTKDVRLVNVWGYARLVGYTDKLKLEPDILEHVDVQEDRVFILYLRKGHKWSDGHPFTSEDFRYYYEDVALNAALTPAGLEPFMLASGQPPEFTVLDETRVQFAWESPNPLFLPELAKASPPFIYRPAHYLKQFHARYGDPGKIRLEAEKQKVRGWAPLHNRLDDMYGFSNPDQPTLQPWLRQGGDNDRRFVMVRNPYYHRVDTTGQQLPYIDRIVLTVADSKLIPAKTQAGESNLQARGLSFADITVLKRGEKQSGYKTALWPNAKGSEVAILPNLTVKDPVWRALLRDARFRHALSLGIDREMVNRVLFFGLGKDSNDTVLAQSPLYRERYRRKWAQYDPVRANHLLDEIGLLQHRGDGVRYMPDGRPLEIIIETTGERSIDVDVLELVGETWRDIGVKVFPKPSQRDLVRKRAITGDLVMCVYTGFENGIPTADMPPVDFVPSSVDQLSWASWGDYYETAGANGEKVDWEPAIQLSELYASWLQSMSDQERRQIWQKILDIHADQTIHIGLVNEVSQPVVIKDVENVPDHGIYGWDPGAQFGIHRMDEFWMKKSAG